MGAPVRRGTPTSRIVGAGERPAPGEAVTASVVLGDAAAGDDAMRSGLRELVRRRLSKHLLPRRVVSVDALPRTESGK